MQLFSFKNEIITVHLAAFSEVKVFKGEMFEVLWAAKSSFYWCIGAWRLIRNS